MQLAVVNNATIQCDQGTRPCKLTATHGAFIKVGSESAATVADRTPGENFTDFGACKLVGEPCEPLTPDKWFPGAEFTPLAADAFLLCVRHGVAAISVRDPGQSTTFIPSYGAVAAPIGPYYYIYRYYDFLRRNPGMTPPDYYLEYGNKFLNLFRAAEFSNRGEEWARDVERDLQEAIEALRRIDPDRFAALERAGAKFRKFAFDTHPEIYRRNGFLELSHFDQVHIFKIVATNSKLSQFGENADQFVEFIKRAGSNPLETYLDLIESHFYQTPKHAVEESIEFGKGVMEAGAEKVVEGAKEFNEAVERFKEYFW